MFWLLLYILLLSVFTATIAQLGACFADLDPKDKITYRVIVYDEMQTGKLFLCDVTL